VVVAPLLAHWVVNYLATAPKLQYLRGILADFVKSILPERFRATVLGIEFWKTLATVVAVGQLGNAVLNQVNQLIEKKMHVAQKNAALASEL
jgi:hypothetical protein